MKTILLTQGKEAQVDEMDYAWLSQWKWHARKQKLKGRTVWYAGRTVNLGNGKFQKIHMHREIAERACISTADDIDHVNGETLDNWRGNLRPATRSQTNQNKRKRPNCASRFKGVSWQSQQLKWQARICINGIAHSLGCFTEERQAAEAYNCAARNAFKDYALVNQI
jgi:hypothetical protein